MRNKDSLGDRMKKYEKVASQGLYRRTPVIIRVDGRAFHTFTCMQKFTKPFDLTFIRAMVNAASMAAKEMQGFKFGYVQSDEASFFLSDYDDLETQPWFGYDLSKVVSVSAALMTVHFNLLLPGLTTAIFDSRAFNIPEKEVANYFLWRAKDWERNSLQMYARSVFSQKELHGKKKEDIHEMLYQKGRNWTKDVPMQEKNGTFLLKDAEIKYALRRKIDILPNYESISNAIETIL